jgi:hypothetical protein
LKKFAGLVQQLDVMVKAEEMTTVRRQMAKKVKGAADAQRYRNYETPLRM